jgi:molybdenum cofactor cytidylyltransferase
MVTGLILSAGLSERFGSPKALANLSTGTVIQHVQDSLLQSACGKIVVVLGGDADKILPFIFIHSKISVVYNNRYYFGQTTSVQEGWRHAEESSEGIMLLPVDCPLVKVSTIDQIIGHFNQQAPDILVPSYQHKKGHPPVFHQRLRTKVLGLSDNQGLNSLFADHPPQTIDIDDPGIVKSFNTPQEFEEIKKSAEI